MTHRDHASTDLGRLFWVGVIALAAAVILTWFRTESLPLTLAFGFASAAISVAIVWFVDWTSGRR